MLTAKEVEEQNLIEGKDYLYLDNVRYRVGDYFLRNGYPIGVKRIIDPHHFITDRYESWHTGMFETYLCEHGKNMIPFEYDRRKIAKFEVSLMNGKVFSTTVFTIDKDGAIERIGEHSIGYDNSTHKFSIKIKDKETKDAFLQKALKERFGDMHEEMLYVLQECGENGNMPKEVLLDKGCKKLKYEDIDHTLICKGKMLEQPKTTMALLKRHCYPSQRFVIVKGFDKVGVYTTGETITERSSISGALLRFVDGIDVNTLSFGDENGKSEAEL